MLLALEITTIEVFHFVLEISSFYYIYLLGQYFIDLVAYECLALECFTEDYVDGTLNRLVDRKV